MQPYDGWWLSRGGFHAPRHIFQLQVGIFGLRHIDEAASLIGALCAVCTSNTFIIKIPITTYFDAWMYARIYLFNTPTIVVT